MSASKNPYRVWLVTEKPVKKTDKNIEKILYSGSFGLNQIFELVFSDGGDGFFQSLPFENLEKDSFKNPKWKEPKVPEIFRSVLDWEIQNGLPPYEPKPKTTMPEKLLKSLPNALSENWRSVEFKAGIGKRRFLTVFDVYK